MLSVFQSFFFSKKIFQESGSVSNSLDPCQARSILVQTAQAIGRQKTQLYQRVKLLGDFSCYLSLGDSYGGAICSKSTVMVVSSVLRRQLCWCYLFKGDSYGGFICSKATVMVVVSVLRRQLWWSYLFKGDSYGGAICTISTVKVVLSVLGRKS